MQLKTILAGFGPGLITAAVVLGPGTVTTAGKLGAGFGYRMTWLVVAATVFMATYTVMGARCGCAVQTPLLSLVAQKYGRWLAVITGLSALLVTAAFQSVNNVGVSTAMTAMFPELERYEWIFPIVFTGLSLAFLFGARNVYRLLELVMMALVAGMIVAFLSTFAVTGVSWSGVARGLIPGGLEVGNDVPIAMLATTFSVIAAMYQAYLVQEKQWGIPQMSTGVRDALCGIAILGILTFVIMCTAVATFHGTQLPIRNAADLALQLKQVFGGGARFIFSAGFAAAAFSSFVMNAIIGGGLAADGLGLPCSMRSLPSRLLAAAVMLVGMLIAVGGFRWGWDPAAIIVAAQAMLLPAVPLSAVVLLLLSNSSALPARLRNGIMLNTLAGAGFLTLLWLTVIKSMDMYQRLVAG